jgi:Transposase DDE domain
LPTRGRTEGRRPRSDPRNSVAAVFTGWYRTKDYRKASRLENEAVLDRMAARLKARPDILDRRREIVEHPFGSIKQGMNQGAFLMKGLDNVRAEFSLTALVYNLRRALNILGAEAMMAGREARYWPDRPTWTTIASSQQASCARMLKHR